MSSFFNIIGHSELLGHGEGANSQSTSCSLGRGGGGSGVTLQGPLKTQHTRHSVGRSLVRLLLLNRPLTRHAAPAQLRQCHTEREHALGSLHTPHM